MSNYLKKMAISTLLFSVATTAPADDLNQVFLQAVHNDPTFKQAESTWYSEQQQLSIARSQYLLHVGGTAEYGRDFRKSRNPNAATSGYNYQTAYTLTATQPIFNYAAWTAISDAKATVKAATANYLASIQDLMQRTANAYFAVLIAYERLRYTEANKRAVYRQYTTARQQFKVGLIAITGVYEAKARYDQQVANEISDKNELYDALENLRAITGQHYASLHGIADQIPLITPAPKNINRWVDIAEAQNYSIRAQNYTVIAAHENIKNQASAWVPELDAEGTYSHNINTNYDNGNPKAASRETFVGLSMSWTPLQGGLTYANTKQARYDYLTASGQLEFVHRQVVNQTRQAYLAITSDISQIKSDRQAIISSKNALRATEAGYTVGTRTMVDVLDSISELYQNEEQYSDDQYDYLNQIVNLKEAAGTLRASDLSQLNSWMKETIRFPLPKNLYNRHGKFGSSVPMAPVHKVKSAEKNPVMQKPKASRPHRSTKKTAMMQKPVLGAPNHYTIQLFSAKSKPDALAFMHSQKKPNHLRIEHSGGYYRVVTGDYSTISAAHVAIAGLSSDLLAHHPWVLPEKRVVSLSKITLPAPQSV